MAKQNLTGKTRLTDRKRAAILEASVAEFHTSGYENTSMDRISEVANVSKRTVYNHFASKEILFEEIIKELLNRCDQISHCPYSDAKSLDEQLRMIGKQVLSLTTSDDFQALVRVILSRILQSPELGKQLLGEPKQLHCAFTEWMKQAEQAGRLRIPDLYVAAKQFMGLMEAFAFWPLVFGKTSLTEEQQACVIDSTVRMFLDHYEVRETPRTETSV